MARTGSLTLVSSLHKHFFSVCVEHDVDVDPLLIHQHL